VSVVRRKGDWWSETCQWQKWVVVREFGPQKPPYVPEWALYRSIHGGVAWSTMADDTRWVNGPIKPPTVAELCTLQRNVFQMPAPMQVALDQLFAAHPPPLEAQ